MQFSIFFTSSLIKMKLYMSSTKREDGNILSFNNTCLASISLLCFHSPYRKSDTAYRKNHSHPIGISWLWITFLVVSWMCAHFLGWFPTPLRVGWEEENTSMMKITLCKSSNTRNRNVHFLMSFLLRCRMLESLKLFHSFTNRTYHLEIIVVI